MTITGIKEINNKQFPKLEPIKENMNIKIPDIIDGIPNRNGFIWVLTGSGGSGKSSLLLNFFRSDKLYRGKFTNIFYICPLTSYLSVKDHPFEEHTEDRIFHDLNEEILTDIESELREIKKENSEIDKDKDYQYNCVIIDDFADALKDKDIEKKLNQLLIKARHYSCAFIFTLQSYYYLPKILRKQITNITIFKPKNQEEWDSITKELLHMNKDDGNKLYDFVYDKPYNHLDIDTIDNKLYKNFNLLDIIYK